MQRMICISAEQYNLMMESYDRAMKELRALRRQLRAAKINSSEDQESDADDED